MEHPMRHLQNHWDEKKRWRIEIFIYFSGAQCGVWVGWRGKSSPRILWARVVSFSGWVRSEVPRILQITNSPSNLSSIHSLSGTLEAESVRDIFEAVSFSGIKIYSKISLTMHSSNLVWILVAIKLDSIINYSFAHPKRVYLLKKKEWAFVYTKWESIYSFLAPPSQCQMNSYGMKLWNIRS